MVATTNSNMRAGGRCFKESGILIKRGPAAIKSIPPAPAIMTIDGRNSKTSTPIWAKHGKKGCKSIEGNGGEGIIKKTAAG